MPTRMYRVPEKNKFKKIKTDHHQQQQQNVSTDSQQQQQLSPSYLASNEMNQFLQVSGEIEEMIGCFSRPSLQIPDLERFKTIMEPNTLEFLKTSLIKSFKSIIWP
ncbi:hypothetical protein CEXT_742721 [Caerostris extrusa]|uniref:Uncharacterized protein n=1 Tax=Caerostris extrusa TaxID=172846 RepID=A0AAV4U8T5_CAEEX|nr:hypothetical protein CEXT_742721 [Caerostris extrusa]